MTRSTGLALGSVLWCRGSALGALETVPGVPLQGPEVGVLPQGSELAAVSEAVEAPGNDAVTAPAVPMAEARGQSWTPAP
eukprot:2776860-Alexandrium_andersonii.AAC.1